MKKLLILLLLVAAVVFIYTSRYGLEHPSAFWGTPEEQMLWGYKYSHGEGVLRNDEKAVYWFSKAARGGNIDAMHYLADILELRPETMKDAICWYEKALQFEGLEEGYKSHLEQSLGYAYFNMGGAYLMGEGVKKDPKKAMEFIEKSALKKGEELPKLALYKFYSEGFEDSILPDREKAAYWLKLAADEGSETASEILKSLKNSDEPSQ